MDAKSFGVFLARTRRERGLTQSALAEQLHVTDKAVSRWERGLGFPDIGTLGPLAQALGLLAASQARLRECQQENARLRQKLEELRIISRAKCLLVEYLHLSEEQAHKYMERQAMEERKTRRAVAEEVLREYG